MTIEEFFINEYNELKQENKKLKEDNAGLHDWARDAERVVQELIGALKIVVNCAKDHISDDRFSTFIYKDDGLEKFMSVLENYGLIVKEETNEKPEITQEELAK